MRTCCTAACVWIGKEVTSPGLDRSPRVRVNSGSLKKVERYILYSKAAPVSLLIMIK